jgi:hypothetical protein
MLRGKEELICNIPRSLLFSLWSQVCRNVSVTLSGEDLATLHQLLSFATVRRHCRKRSSYEPAFRGQHCRFKMVVRFTRRSPYGLPGRFKKKKTPWSESASELYRPSDRRLSAKWLPTFADRECHVVSVTDPYCRILGFLSSSSLVGLTRLSGPRSRPTAFFPGSAGNRTRASGSVAKNSDHQTTEAVTG